MFALFGMIDQFVILVYNIELDMFLVDTIHTIRH